MANGYTSHVFIGYRRGGDAEEWVRGVLVPELRSMYVENCTLRPERPLFLDEDQIDNGADLNCALRDGILGSRLMLPVFTPSYFGSR